MKTILEKLKNELCKFDEENTHIDVVTRDSLILERLFAEIPISGRPENRFFYDSNSFDIVNTILTNRMKRQVKAVIEMSGRELFESAECRGYTGLYDFGHTAPDYKNVFSLGLRGLLERLEKNSARAKNDEERKYYEAGVRVWRAALGYLERAAECACGKEQAEALRGLTKRPPQTLYEAIQLSFAYYVIQHCFDLSNVRTLGRLDALYEPFREADEASGRLNEAQTRELIGQMYRELDEWRIRANIPFAIGGADKNGASAVNEMSKILLEEYAKAALPYVKLHFLYTDDMPKDFVKIALGAVRSGANSICFIGDKTVVDSLVKLGEDVVDAQDYAVVGCYECGGRGEITCSCNARVNIPKAIELVLNNGRDMATNTLLGVELEGEPESYEEFYKRFLIQLKRLCDSAIRLTDVRESQYKYLHSAPILSSTYDACVENGKDIYCQSGAKYCNSSVNAFGIATAVDSLLAVKQFVYGGELSFGELSEIIKNNWEGNEALRLRAEKRMVKYGTGNVEADLLAAEIFKILADYINGRPNVKGGIYRFGTFSINWRWEFGAKTAATPDGRRCGEPVSQNLSTSLGADTAGATALISSVTRQDMTLTPNGSVLDLDLHSSAVVGEDGLEAMYSTLVTYMKLGGFAIHYNVLDASTLRAAMEKPEDYPNLQVRLCGWNVLFSNLSKEEQLEFIKRSSAEA